MTFSFTHSQFMRSPAIRFSFLVTRFSFSAHCLLLITCGPSVIRFNHPSRNQKRKTRNPLSSHVAQPRPQFLRGTEKCVLGGLFGGVQHLADGPQLQSLVVLQLKD